EAPAEWQTAVEAALGEWLSGFGVDELPVSGRQWPDDALTLVATGAPESERDAAGLVGLPCLASRISAPPAIMAAAGRVFVADDVEAALAARTELAPGQTIVSLNGACVGPAMLRTPAHEAGGRGV